MNERILGFDKEDVKLIFLVFATSYAFLRLFRGNIISAFIIMTLVFYYFYRENKSEDWQAFKKFLKEFNEKQKEKKKKMREQGLTDDELINKLQKEMEEKQDV